ncbi:MAG: flagellar biosynthetic protein FliO [Bdellovibrionales bacterium]|nr:flagellar biosynthetic protein FliO [Bdellovibrionales bacterium]
MKKLVLIGMILTSINLLAADVTIKGADLLNAKGSEARLSIKHAGTLNDNPRISINDKTLNITIPGSGLAGKIKKSVNGTNLSATMSGEETVAITVNLPYSLKGREADVAITLKEGAIDVIYPRLELAKKAAPEAQKTSRSPAVIDREVAAVEPANNAEAEKLDENYLSSLMKKQEKLAEVKHPEAAPAGKAGEQLASDRVNLAQASVAKAGTTAPTSATQSADAEKSRFSVAGYVGKFVAFLSLMIAGFYGVLTLFKKGIIKKGKLGFLNSTKLVEVLSTTHIAPKKSLIMIKAHKQVFLISNTENGIQLVSEINDVAGLIKSGEEEITGSNFDTNLYSANKTEKEFRLKEVPRDSYGSDNEDYEMDSLDDMLNDTVPARKAGNATNAYAATNASRAIEKAPVKDQVRFSDQIKTKVKNLKQL